MRYKTLLSVTLAGGLILTGSLTSCKKEQDTLAKITVLDEDGEPFSNATVRIFGEPTVEPHNEMIIDRTLYSDASGEVIFDFTRDFNLGCAGFTVLNIELSSGDTLFGEGIIKVEEEKINEETVIIQPL